MLDKIQVKHHNLSYDGLTQDYHSKNTNEARSFTAQLLQNQNKNRDNSDNIQKLVEMTKNDVRASFDNSIIQAFGKISLDEWYENQLILEQTHSERYIKGKAYIKGTQDDDTMSLLYNFGTNVYGTQWDSHRHLPIIEEELREREFTLGSNISKEQLQKSMESLAAFIDKILNDEYEKELNSSPANALLILRAELDLLPEKWEKRQKQAVESLQSINLDSNAEEINEQLQQIDFGLSRTALIDIIDVTNKTAAIIYAHLSPKEQEEMLDSVHNITMYYAKQHYNENLIPDSLQMRLKQENITFQENLTSRFSTIDNSEILLNLSSDSHLQTNAKESKAYEGLIDKIRSKLKTTNDSILQQVMSKITNGVKANGIGEGA